MRLLLPTTMHERVAEPAERQVPHDGDHRSPGGSVSEIVSRPETGSASFLSDPAIPSMWDEDPVWPGSSSEIRDGNATLEVVSDDGITMLCGLDREGLAAAAELLFLDHSYCGEVLVVLTDDNAVRDLNNRYRGIDRSTDVLSFDLSDDDGAAGEVYISLPIADRQAASYGVDTATEVCRLAIHGMLHLVGHDDQTEEDEARMARETEHYLGAMTGANSACQCSCTTPVRAFGGSVVDPLAGRVAGGSAGRGSSPPPEAAACGGLCECPAGCPEEVEFRHG